MICSEVFALRKASLTPFYLPLVTLQKSYHPICIGENNMKAKLPLIARILLGLIFFIFGIAGLFNLLPPPPNMPEDMMTFMAGMLATGYFFPLLKITEIVCGALLLLGMFVPLALVVLAPIVVHIFMVHAALDPSGLPIAIVIVVLMGYLSFCAKPYSNTIKLLFKK